MSATGYIQVKAYTSRARIPLADVSVTITGADQSLLGLRLTDESGITQRLDVTVPELSQSQQPEQGAAPFTTVNLYARKNNYEQIEIHGLQVFADTVTLQELAMIPLSELPGNWEQAEIFDTPPQNL